MPKTTLDNDTHIYRVDNRETISVTQVTEALYQCDKWYAERGQFIHTMCELYKQGILDEDTLDPQLLPYLNALKLFECDAPYIKGIGDYKSGTKAKWHLLQCAAYRELWLNGLDENGEPLKNIKHGYEVIGFHPIYNYCGTIDLIDIENETGWNLHAFILYLKENGKYKVDLIYPADIARHTRAFLTLVSAKHIRKEYKI